MESENLLARSANQGSIAREENSNLVARGKTVTTVTATDYATHLHRPFLSIGLHLHCVLFCRRMKNGSTYA